MSTRQDVFPKKTETETMFQKLVARKSFENTLNSVKVQDFRVEETDSLWNRDRVPKESKKILHRKKGTILYNVTILIFAVFAASEFLLALQFVEAFHPPRTREGMRQVHKQQLLTMDLSSRPTALQLYDPSKSVRDAKAPINYGITAIGINSISDGSVSNSNTSILLLSKYNTSGSIGYFSSSLLGEDQAWKSDAASSNTTTSPVKKCINVGGTEDSAATIKKSDLFSWIRKPNGDVLTKESSTRMVDLNIDNDAAKELDNSVFIRITNSVKDLRIIKPQNECQIKPRSRVVEKIQQQRKAEIRNAAEEKLKSSKTSSEGFNVADNYYPSLEHYSGRIGRDMRHLAVLIASCIDSVDEWQHFCHQSIGGIEPLIECIREGAESLRKGSPSSPSFSSDDRHLMYPIRSIYTHGQTLKEEYLLVISKSCRVLRDLCTLSQELAAIVTDALLRANAAYKSKREITLMDDLCTILHEVDNLINTKTYGFEKETQNIERQLLMGREKEKLVQTVKETRMNSDSWCKWQMRYFQGYVEAYLHYKLHVIQLLLAMTFASDSAVDVIRQTDLLKDVLLTCSSYTRIERRRRWMAYLGEKLKPLWIAKQMIRKERSFKVSAIETLKKRCPHLFIEALSLQNNLHRKIEGTANQILAAIGYNEWVPKIPGQKGLRILCLDGGGSRGMTSVVAVKCLVDSLGGMEVADCFDFVVGTSTGAIIAFLVGLNRETSEKAVERYDALIEKIFTKSAFSTPMLLFTTASYDESTFMDVLTEILGDNTMLDNRADPAAPLVFAVTSKMSSNPTHVALFRNYNYNGGEQPDPFVVHPNDARENLTLLLDDEAKIIRHNTYPKKKGIEQPSPGTVTPDNGSRHPGSFRILQKNALRASTAAPTVFKPVLMGGEMYCDGGIVASNPSAIAIHEARTVFPHVPIELVVSIGTGGFTEFKSEPRIGWDGIIGQIINSATDAEQIHHILEDVLGDRTTIQGKSSVSNTTYMRFNPTLGMPDEFPIDVTDPEKLQQIKTITYNYMKEPEQMEKLGIIADILKGRGSSRFETLFRGVNRC